MRYSRFFLVLLLLSKKDTIEVTNPTHAAMLAPGKISPKTEQIKPMIELQRLLSFGILHLDCNLKCMCLLPIE